MDSSSRCCEMLIIWNSARTKSIDVRYWTSNAFILDSEKRYSFTANLYENFRTRPVFEKRGFVPVLLLCPTIWVQQTEKRPQCPAIFSPRQKSGHSVFSWYFSQYRSEQYSENGFWNLMQCYTLSCSEYILWTFVPIFIFNTKKRRKTRNFPL